jgi:LmbE family N-acetylglucosaminyl deacetylase
MKKLMVVAHPDDESLFGGAQLLQGGWMVVCVTNGYNAIRRAEFEQVMHITNSEFQIWNYCDYDGYKTRLDNLDLLRQDLVTITGSQSWHRILTHNQHGEYGHLHHIQVHYLMEEVVGKSLWTFNFSQSRLLTPDVWQAKLRLIDIYKSEKNICDIHVPNVKNEGTIRDISFL